MRDRKGEDASTSPFAEERAGQNQRGGLPKPRFPPALSGAPSDKPTLAPHFVTGQGGAAGQEARRHHLRNITCTQSGIVPLRGNWEAAGRGGDVLRGGGPLGHRTVVGGTRHPGGPRGGGLSRSLGGGKGVC